jgi:hypothetical protein
VVRLVDGRPARVALEGEHPAEVQDGRAPPDPEGSGAQGERASPDPEGAEAGAQGARGRASPDPEGSGAPDSGG